MIVQIADNELYINDFACHFPIIRWIDNHRFLIADKRNPSKQENLSIFDTTGRLLTAFYCGDAISTIEVTKEGIWISYFDEGIFGNGISTEGIVLFSFEGTPLFKYHSDLKEKPFITDCYATCKGKGNSLWVLPYSDFPLLCLDTANKTINHTEIPKVLFGSSALTVRGNFAYFYSPYHDEHKLFSLEIQSKQIHTLGKIHGVVRGLSPKDNYHFIAKQDNAIKGYTVLNDAEYRFVSLT